MLAIKGVEVAENGSKIDFIVKVGSVEFSIETKYWNWSRQQNGKLYANNINNIKTDFERELPNYINSSREFKVRINICPAFQTDTQLQDAIIGLIEDGSLPSTKNAIISKTGNNTPASIEVYVRDRFKVK